MLIWISMLVACTNSGLGRESTGDTGPDIVECPWVGDWDLTTMKCGGSFDYNGWFDSYPNASMQVSNGVGGGCVAQFTWSSDTCTETESWTLEPQYPEESTVQWDGSTHWVNEGVTTCDPAACEFDGSAVGATESACAEGDRSNPTVVVVSVDATVDGQLTIGGLLGDGDRGNCSLDPTSTWVRR